MCCFVLSCTRAAFTLALLLHSQWIFHGGGGGGGGRAETHSKVVHCCVKNVAPSLKAPQQVRLSSYIPTVVLSNSTNDSPGGLRPLVFKSSCFGGCDGEEQIRTHSCCISLGGGISAWGPDKERLKPMTHSPPPRKTWAHVKKKTSSASPFGFAQLKIIIDVNRMFLPSLSLSVPGEH